MTKIALFAYAFPHRKTQDFILELTASSVAEFVVFAAPRKDLKFSDSRKYFRTTSHHVTPLTAEVLCSRLRIPYFEVDHDDARTVLHLIEANRCTMGLIAGARIIRKDVLCALHEGTINIHPGKLPETSGLDAFFYSIQNHAPPGVTAHIVDEPVDAGSQIFFSELPIDPACSEESLLEGVYALQIAALRRVLDEYVAGDRKTTPINCPKKNQPMSVDEKLAAVARFPSWRADQYLRQQFDRLVAVTGTGDTKQALQILDSHPSLISRRTSEQWTPIIVASHFGSVELVRTLLQRGANPNDTGRNGTTVLMYAKTKLLHRIDADYEILSILIESGASVTRTDCFGKTVLDYVRSSGDERMLTFLSGYSCGGAELGIE